MKRTKSLITIGLGAVAFLTLSGFSKKAEKDAALSIGKPAPAFTAVDQTGKTHNLADYKGKYVVLEWLNHGCPYVRKHYDSKNMQKTQEALKKKGAVWFSVVSSAPGKQGYMAPKEAIASIKQYDAKPSAILMDPKGEIGQAYGAKTTPHMFIIDPSGNLVYQGAIDSIRSSEIDDIPKATNYVLEAFTALESGKPVKSASTVPYGCSIKYAN